MQKAFFLVVTLLLSSVALAELPEKRVNEWAGNDIVVHDQDGQERAFFKDLIGDQLAIVNFIYTHCEGICSTLGQRMVKLQKALGPSRRVALVSMSLDPERDTPKALKSWAKNLGAKAGWTLVTGHRKDLDVISERIFGTGLISRDMHAPVLVLRDKKGKWIRLDGLTPVKQLLAKLNAEFEP